MIGICRNGVGRDFEVFLLKLIYLLTYLLLAMGIHFIEITLKIFSACFPTLLKLEKTIQK